MTSRRNGRVETATMARQVRCAIYTRKSTDEGLDSGFSSLDAQREACEAYIASQKHEGWTCLRDRYDDGGVSGATMDRPALRRLLADTQAGMIDCIVFYRLDRLSRYLPDFARIMEILDAKGCAIVSVTEALNTSTPSGRLHLNMVMSFAQHEREVISERTRDKMSAARRKGRWTGGSPVLGYDIDPDGGRIHVNEEEAARVRAIFDLYLEKASLLATVRELRRLGWTSKRWTTRHGTERGGLPITKATLSYLLANRLYAGQVAFRGEVYAGEHEAIVDPETFERAQALLGRNGRTRNSDARNKHGALLKGLLRCAACEAAMTPTYTRKGERRYRYYRCVAAQQSGQVCPAGWLPAGEIERFVVDRIRSIGSDPELQAAVLTRLREGDDPVDDGVVRQALAEFEGVWARLTPRRQARVAHLLLERVVYDAREETIAMTFRPTMLEALSAEETP